MNMKKRLIFDILSVLFQTIDAVLCKLHFKRPIIIFYLDGGICSQMNMYVQGQYYSDRGFDVYYDIHWYDTWNDTNTGVNARFWELEEMWPNLKVKTLTAKKCKFYRNFFQYKRTNGDWLPELQSISRTLYFGGYWDISATTYSKIFHRCFDLRNAAIPAIKGEKNFNNTIGVHVRRGDLAKGDNPIYGGVTDGYFLRAIEFCNEKFAPKKYIFFSDEPDWVEQNICNHLEQSYVIMRGNKVWEDLWLLAQCPVIVASQGSFGTVAARLNPDAVLIQCDNEHASRERQNTYFVK